MNVCVGGGGVGVWIQFLALAWYEKTKVGGREKITLAEEDGEGGSVCGGEGGDSLPFPGQKKSRRKMGTDRIMRTEDTGKSRLWG